MPWIQISLYVDAPLERCIDLARSIDLHQRSTARADLLGGFANFDGHQSS